MLFAARLRGTWSGRLSVETGLAPSPPPPETRQAASLRELALGIDRQEIALLWQLLRHSQLKA
ncbi:hypothetical protein SBA7_350027 [Candidatus Sulfotelmatobacter sp. SbA7]|nr:hypothetical protein SBA7_350027 [Candidatus Sulfotelmatobacter sp. SbA7]